MKFLTIFIFLLKYLKDFKGGVVLIEFTKIYKWSVKKFYLLTHVPIQAINYEGKSIGGDVGYSRSHEHFFP